MIKFVPTLKKRVKELVGDFPHLEEILDLLSKMLQLDPKKRPAPIELLSHPLFSI
jgi:serine/threonine protein kinase